MQMKPSYQSAVPHKKKDIGPETFNIGFNDASEDNAAQQRRKADFTTNAE